MTTPQFQAELARLIEEERQERLTRADIKEMTIAPTYHAPLPLLSDYDDLESSDDLARMLLAYFAACAVEAGLKEARTKLISISPRTAWRVGRRRIFFSLEVMHEVWSVHMAMWLGVDKAGNGFEYGSEGWSTHLSFEYLRKLPAAELKHMLDCCNPFAEYYNEP